MSAVNKRNKLYALGPADIEERVYRGADRSPREYDIVDYDDYFSVYIEIDFASFYFRHIGKLGEVIAVERDIELAYGKLHSFKTLYIFRYPFGKRNAAAKHTDESDLIEIVEIPGLKWYIGTQFHPEYQSTVLKPHPLFLDFVRVAGENHKA